MRVAVDWCLAKGLPVRRCTLSQLRVGPINFWPDSGTINFEASTAANAEGLAAFRRLVLAWFSLTELEQETELQTLGELGVNALEERLLKRYLL